MKFSLTLRALHSTTTTTRCCFSNNRARNVRLLPQPVCALINEIFRNGEKERGSRSMGEHGVLESVIVNDSSIVPSPIPPFREAERERRERELLSFAT